MLNVELTVPIESLTKEQLTIVLDNKDLVKKFITSVENYVKEQIQSGDHDWSYKLINGRGKRTIIKEELEKVASELDVELFKKQPKTLEEIEMLIGKDLMNQVTEMKESNTLQLVPIVNKKK